MAKILVAYFSASGVTARAAREIAGAENSLRAHCAAAGRKKIGSAAWRARV